MKAVLKASPTAGLELRTVPDPTPAYGEVVLQVRASSMCGTDTHIYDWNNWARHWIKPPRILGHEMFGEVVAVGKGVSGERRDRGMVGVFVPPRR
jgi:threonine 3-dehydrogenase